MDLGITGKRAVVAASSAGLGFEAARHLAAEGVKVVMCGRHEAKLTAAAKAVGPNVVHGMVSETSTGDRGGRVDHWVTRCLEFATRVPSQRDPALHRWDFGCHS